MKFFLLLFSIGITGQNALAINNETINHELFVKLIPVESKILATDRITIPDELCSKKTPLQFYLHPHLKPYYNSKKLQPKRQTSRGEVKAVSYEITPNDTCVFDLQYQGTIKHPVRDDHSPGTIEPQGVSLFGSTYWYPIFDDHLISFKLKVELPPSWHSVSQGEGLDENTWQELQPQDGIYLIAARFHVYKKQTKAVNAQVYLRTADQELAENYLRLTQSYVQMYNKLLGPYPYKKFALVENFWETGFGMPSFTLLGSRVLRLPFIPYTSYPHEILHNWWGNSVYINFQKGNWAEGLTSYLADHYLSAQRGQGKKYRRQILQNYQAYTKESRDFPLSEFRSRHNSSSQAIGYGKAAHFFHMLRVQLGEKLFFDGLKHFYKNKKFKMASYDDLKASFESVSGESLKTVFGQWVNRTGSPKLQMNRSSLSTTTKSIELSLIQVQKEKKYELSIPYQVNYTGQTAEKGLLRMSEKQQSWQIAITKMPESISIDPELDVFRHLYSQESPASFSVSFGEEKKVYLIVPSANNSEDKYKIFAQKFSQHLKSRNRSLIVQISEVKDILSLPEDGVVWLFGWQNRFLDEIQTRLTPFKAQLSSSQLTVKEGIFSREETSIFLTLKLAQNSNQVINWVGLNDNSDVSALVRKIPHYGSYSYIAFDVDSKNQLKSQWPVTHSPLTRHYLSSADKPNQCTGKPLGTNTGGCL